MGFDTTGLSEYVQNNSTAIATKAVASAKTAKMLIDSKNFQAGVKGSAAVKKMSQDIAFTDASSCGRTANGSTKLSAAKIVVAPIAENSNICPATLWNTYFADMISKGQNPEETLITEFASAITDDRAVAIAAGVENLLWNGDTDSSDANLDKIDGIVKQMAASTGSTLTATGSDIIAKLQNIYSQIPVAIRKSADFKMFLGEDDYDSYLIALANNNIFKPTDDFTLYGTTAKLEPVSGLNESGDVYAMRLSNLQLGMDGEADSTKASMEYSNETKQWYLDFAFAVGVTVVDPTEAYVASL